MFEVDWLLELDC